MFRRQRWPWFGWLSAADIVTGQWDGRSQARSDWVAELRAAAMSLAGHGWPVLPATYAEGGSWQGRAKAAGLLPVEPDWATSWTVRPAEVAHVWASEPFGVLVACGHGVGLIELPATPMSPTLPSGVSMVGGCNPAR